MLSQYRNSAKAIATLVGFAIFCDMLVYGVFIPVLPHTATLHGIPAAQLGYYLSTYSFGMVVTPLVAILSDKLKNRKIPMVLSSLLLCFATFSFAFGNDPYSFLFGRMGQGIAGGVSWMIGFSMLAEAFPSNLGATMGSVMTANTIGNLAGPPIGGVLFDSVGVLAPLYFCSAICIIDTLIRLTIRPNIFSIDYPVLEQSQDDCEESPLLVERDETDIEEQRLKNGGIWKLIANVEMIITLLAIIIGEAVLTGIEPTLPLYLSDKLGLNASSIGILWIFISIPKMFACTGAGFLSDRFGRKRITALGLLILTVACILVSQANLYFLAPALSVFGVGAGIALTPGVPEMAEIAKSKGDSSYGTVYSLYNFASSFGMLIGPIVGSWIYTDHGFSNQMLLFGFCSAITFFLVLVHDQSKQKL
jgi:MFS family permease